MVSVSPNPGWFDADSPPQPQGLIRRSRRVMDLNLIVFAVLARVIGAG
jgi:hypothetical protein